MNFFRSSTLFLCFILFVLLTSGCVKRARVTISSANPISNQANAQQTSPKAATKPININTAKPSELEMLPGIGKALAARIVEHREKFGPFRRAEHLIIVRGISDRRFRTLQELITVE